MTIDFLGEETRTPLAGHRRILHTRRTIFASKSEWAVPSPTLEETARLHRCLRTRDDCVLITLSQHRYLTTDQLKALFFPSARTAQRRLRWLVEQRLLMHWDQHAPAEEGWRRRHSMFTLTRRGARLAASVLHTDPRPLVKRSFQAIQAQTVFVHGLEINGFFVALASAARDRPDEGLYNWIGQDRLKQGSEERGSTDLFPDGRGRYLLPDGEIRFDLEWDRATEGPGTVADKARRYLRSGGGVDHVLFVFPWASRERRVRALLAEAIRRARNPRHIEFWTASLEELNEQGPLGAIWRPVEDRDRVAFTDLGARPLQEAEFEGCIGKPGWWFYRSGGGEGG